MKVNQNRCKNIKKGSQYVKRILFFMRCSFIALMVQLTFLGMLYANIAKSQALEQKINLDLENAGVKESLSKVQQLGGIKFLFDDVLIRSVEKKVSIHANAISVKQAIEAILSNTALKYRLIDGFVTIDRKALQPPPGVIEGVIYDARTKETLIGAVIIVQGISYQADANGHYRITLQPGIYDLEIRYIGYQSKKLSGISVRSSANTTLNILLQTSSTALNEVRVEARRKGGNEAVLLNDRKNAAFVSDGISAQNIEKTASITTTQALQRVTGVTITDDRYVAIRGLGDRSVIAQLNGARLSSADPDRSAVPLDLVPASLLDNINVIKTLTPDKPADASAGIIELKTKSVPDALTVQFIAQSGFNSNVGVTGQYNGFYNSDLGFFGQNVSKHNLQQDFLSLKDQYPGGLPQIQKLFIQSRSDPAAAKEAMRISDIMQRFDPVLKTSYQKADPNQVYSFSFGNSYKLKGDRVLGVIISANYYQRTEDLYNGLRNQYSIFQGVVTGSPSIFNQLHIPGFITPGYPRLGNYLSYTENTGKKTLNYGGLIGLTYRFNAQNEIQAQYLGSRGAEALGSNLTGQWKNTGLNSPVYNTINQLRQSYRSFDTYNIQGEHKIWNSPVSPRLSYNLSSSKSSQNDPDFRSTDVADLRTIRFNDPNGVALGSDTYAFVTGLVHGAGQSQNNAIIADPNGRQFRKLNETNYSAKADLVQPFKWRGLEQALKFGGNFLRRNRGFSESILGLPGTTLGGGNIQLLNQVGGDINALVSPKYIGLADPSQYNEEGQPRVGGFLYQIRKAPNNYSGTYETRAFYGMLDAHITTDLRLIGGVRFESTGIKSTVDTSQVFLPLTVNSNPYAPGERLAYVSDKPNSSYIENYKPFYSFNLVYNYHKDMNFRLAYSTSLARPELRELINIYEFDPFQFAVVGGNPNLKNQYTRSIDFRWEWFTSPREILSASAFTKTIKNQLQRVFNYQTQGNLSTSPEFPLINFQNDPNQGLVYGFELEARHSLGSIWGRLHDFFFGANILLAASTIDKNPQRLAASRTIDRESPATSPVFEQAPYSINTYLDYDNIKSGTNITTSFNMVGARLIQVQLDGTPDIYDRPAPILDLVFSQRLGKYFTVKGFAKNILNPNFKQVYTNPGNKGLYHGTEYIYRQYNRGAEVSLGLSYKLF